MFRKIGLLSCFIFLAFVLSGCCCKLELQEPDVGMKPNTKMFLQANIMVSENTNPNSDGRPSPVTVRIYQLKSGKKFKNADFPSLYNNDEAILGADFVFKEEMDVHPGVEVPLERELERTTRYLGVMVTFRDFENSTWRALTGLPSKGNILVKIDDLSVSIWERIAIDL
uniref:Type VI secretion system protein VasD n=1 Tax=Candidatus Kentrum sp. TUN TaxID=2126343 RepID=A0A450ZNP5_9GAMM|nr:MAG: type VI secretion system protein VasD [Candidatus Kentron sp. TUN]VFK55360.1 MAG: type VI secretion system protein VasD [Candidatus Kentron sp. TUN]VFK57096.1 MAG: type VI secretion system protein VasD [Candidatus Kentron sp. TUN]